MNNNNKLITINW